MATIVTSLFMFSTTVFPVYLIQEYWLNSIEDSCGNIKVHSEISYRYGTLGLLFKK
jgi:hypothetical protein